MTEIRYGQCWEDADVLLRGLAIQPGDACLSIGAAGDNALAMLCRDPARIEVVDSNPAQLACLDIRIAAFRALEHGELLELLGAVPSGRRLALYRRCRSVMSAAGRIFWDARLPLVERGVINAGRFERYLSLFRERVLPFTHTARCRRGLLTSRTESERVAYFREHWNNRRWRCLFRLFFSRAAMALAGRERAYFAEVSGPVARPLLDRCERALTQQDPSRNPYLHWLLRGHFGHTLPFALRAGNFATIRARVDRITAHGASLQDVLRRLPAGSIDRFNLSDVFEYLPVHEHQRTMARLLEVARPGARLAYWNLFVPRRCPLALSHRVRALDELAAGLHAASQVFFYERLIIEEVLCR